MSVARVPSWLAARGAAWWIGRRRRRHAGAAEPLSDDMLAALAPFFPAATLAAARVAVVVRIPPPLVVRLARRIGLPAVDFDRVLGITFADTVVLAARLRGRERLATLFHELVHVEQARQLGLAEFARRYAVGWWRSGRRYGGIPLEIDAYDLQRRFDAAPERPFDLAAEVARRLAERG